MRARNTLKCLIISSTILTTITACNGSSGGSNNGGDIATVASPITIDNAGVVPLIGNSSTSSVIYVHNHTDSTISGIKYSEVVNTGHSQFINPNSAILCSSIPAHQSCPLAFTTPTLSTTTAQGSAMLSASYTANSQARSFSQVVNFRRVDINTPQGVVFNSGVQLNSAGNKTAFGTIYAYGSGTGKTYTVSSLQSNKKGVTITQGDITDRQIPSGYVTAIEVSSPADFTTTTQKAANQGYEATLSMASQGGGASFQSSSSIGVAPATSGAILTSSNSTIVDSSVATPGGSIFIVNSGNSDATITGITYPSGVTESSGTTCSGVIPSGNGCVINFATPQTSGNGNITVNYTGGASGSIAQTIVWYNSRDGVLLQMSANNNPLSFSATVGGTTEVTVTNIGGYNLSNLTADADTFTGAATATIGDIESCFTSAGAPVESLPVGGYCTYLVSVMDSVTEAGSINLSFSGDYESSGGATTYSRILALGYTSNQYRALLISSPDPMTIQVVGNNESTSAQTMTITNNGEATATISSQALAGGAPAYLTESSNDCGATLDASDDCTAIFILGPTTAEAQESGSTSYDINYTGGQAVGSTLNADIDYTVQANDQNIIMGGILTNGNISFNDPNYVINGTSSTGHIGLEYVNTGTNPIQVTGITNTNSPIAWELDTTHTTCLTSGATQPSAVINPGSGCLIRINSVLGQYANALGNMSNPYNVDITVPTLTFRDTVATGTQFVIQPQTPSNSTTIPVNSTHAIVVNSLTLLDDNACSAEGLTPPCVAVAHSFTNTTGYNPVTVTTKMESYFVLPYKLGAGCTATANNATGILTQECSLSSNGTITTYYQIDTRYEDEYLNALFSIDTHNQIVSLSPLSAQTALIDNSNKWAWMNGSDQTNSSGNYGTKGVESSTNVPVARGDSVKWSDNSGNLWLFGGNPYTSFGNLNDLWKYSISSGQWTWMNGSNLRDQSATYGTKYVEDPANTPGGLAQSTSWTDNNGNFWLFGGRGRDGSQTGPLNNLWRYNTTNNEWTWMSGEPVVGGFAKSNYGSQGVASPTNVPGARDYSMSWVDNNNNLWLFGGSGYNATTSGPLNDLWKYNIATNEWTWVGGTTEISNAGTYGTQGQGSSSNIPPARSQGTTWIDESGNFWLFGGLTNDLSYNSYSFNDLWKYTVATDEWTWVSGSNTTNQTGVYGTKGQAAPANIPGARYGSTAWTDNSGNLWLFGGYYQAGDMMMPDRAQYNDLWKYNTVTNQWTWMNGSNLSGQTGIYGTLGVADANNVPGSRRSGLGWIYNDQLWLFGGYGYAASGDQGALNDLWKYELP